MVWGYGRCRIPFFSITAHFSASGSAWRAAQVRPQPHHPEADTLTDLLAECIRAKAAGAAFYTALSQRIRRRAAAAARHRGAGAGTSEGAAGRVFSAHGERCVPPAACPRLGTAAQDLRCVYTQELKLAERLDAAANTAPSPLHQTLAAMAQQDRCHAQAVRNLLTCLLG